MNKDKEERCKRALERHNSLLADLEKQIRLVGDKVLKTILEDRITKTEDTIRHTKMNLGLQPRQEAAVITAEDREYSRRIAHPND